jgi:hypothetical protein
MGGVPRGRSSILLGELDEVRAVAACLPNDADDVSDAGSETTDHHDAGWRAIVSPSHDEALRGGASSRSTLEKAQCPQRATRRWAAGGLELRLSQPGE